MAMTREETATHDLIRQTLLEEGHKTYAEYFNLFELHLLPATSEAVAYMVPSKGVIYVNRGVDDLDLVTLLMRHEMLHEFLRHGDRYTKLLRKVQGLKDDEEPVRDPKLHQVSNIAADWELSKYYSPEKDFNKIKHMKINGTEAAGLVLELDKPEWLNLSFEELYEKLLEEKDTLEKLIEQNHMSDEPNEEAEQAAEGERQAQLSKEKANQLRREAKKLRKEADAQDAKDSQSQGSSDSSQSSENQNSSSSKAKREKADELEKAANDLEKGAEKLQSSSEDSKEAAEDSKPAFAETEEDKKDREERLKRIKEFMDNVNAQEEIAKEIEEENIERERQKIARKKSKHDKEYIKNLSTNVSLEPMTNFVLDLNRAIKKQTSSEGKDTDTYTRFNRTSSAIGNIYRPGVSQVTPKKDVPIIHVYYDRSGSWYDPRKTEAGDKALRTLDKKYVKTGKIKIKVFYASSLVSANRQEAEAGGVGMYGQPVIDHINQTKPDNVIIMTDSDPEYSDMTSTATVKGCVWMLFSGGTSPKLAAHINGRKGKHYYDLNNVSGLDKMLGEQLKAATLIEALNQIGQAKK